MKKILFFILCLGFIHVQAQNWSQLGLDIDGEAVNDNSGNAVDMNSSGNIVAVGARSNDGNGANSGHVRVYSWNGSSWIQLGQDIDGENSQDQSAWSLSISADGFTLAIGAPNNDGNGINSGHVRVYEYNGSLWVQKGVDIDGENTEDASGYSVSLSDDGGILAIGAVNNDGNGTNSGHVRVYSWNGSSWVQLGADIDGESALDRSGENLDLSGDGSTVAIAAEQNDGNGSVSGHVRIYSWDGVTWNQLGTDIDGEAAFDFSGCSVSINSDGSTVAIGALGNDGNGNISGHTRVFNWNGSNWLQKGLDIDGESADDRSGYSVSLSSNGNILAIGAITNDGNGSNSGHTRIYSWNGTQWIQLGSDIDGESAGDESGFYVSLCENGDKVAIGSIKNMGNGTAAGHARVYSYSVVPISGITWTGTTSTDWSTASNWSSGSVPSSSDEIVIPDVSGASGNFPITSTDITVEDLTIEAGATLTIGHDFGLIIGASGTVTNNGSVILEADVTRTAWLDDFTNSGTTYSGTITAQQYVSSGAALGQRMFGSPVNNGVVSGLNQTYASASTGQVVMSNCPTAQVDVGSPYNNLFEWHEDATTPNNCEYEGWFAITDATPLENGRGYSGWMDLNSVISFTGIPNTGNITYGVGVGLGNSATGVPMKDGWHVLSNPYPSIAHVNPITSLGFISLQTLIAGSAYGGTFQPITFGDDIGVAQGFVAFKSPSPVADVTFTNSMRAQGSVKLKSNNDWYDAKLDIEVSNGNNKDLTYIYFNSQATEAFDATWDCEKRMSFAGIPTLYTSTTGTNTSLNGNNIAELGDYSFPMGLKPESNTTFTFEASGLSTFPASTIIYLEDKATGTWTNLREQSTYTFDMTTSENEDRFEIHFTKPIALTHEAETCEGNDGFISLDFGNQSIAGNLQTWDYEIQMNSTLIASGSEASNLELSNLEPGTYEVVFSNGNLVVTEWVTIDNKLDVEAEFSPSATQLFTGEELVLTNTSVGATDYTWEVNNEVFNTIDLNYTFATPGTYVIRLTSSNTDCEALYEETIIVNEKTTGIAEQIELDKVVVYTKDNSIVIDLSNVDLEGQTDLEIYDLLGKLIVQQLDIETIAQIEMANQAKGYYFVNIINQTEQISKKVIIK